MAPYPGLGLPLRHYPQEDYSLYPVGIYSNCWGSDSDLLPVREVAMMVIMDRLTDKENWHTKVFSEDIVAKWRAEALEYPDKSLWEQAIGGKGDRRFVSVFGADASSPYLKQLTQIMTDSVFDFCLQELRNKARYFESSGLIPTLDACASVAKSDTLVSPALRDELREAFDKLKADQAASPDWHPSSGEMVQDLVHPSMYPLVYGQSRVLNEEVVSVDDAIHKWAGKGEVIDKEVRLPARNQFSDGIGGSTVPASFWSDTYQWLPANVAFQEDGTVKFTSYINNLHPNKHRGIYHTIEKLIGTALPAWDQCLGLSLGYKKKAGAGRIKSRFPWPENPDDENPELWKPSEMPDRGNDADEDEDPEELEEQWRELRTPIQPLPDQFKEIKYAPKDSRRLAVMFKESGLQVIVKMASIELTPEKPEFPIGGWHVEGQMNEHICATALYYLDSENITSSSLDFRMQTSSYMSDDYAVGQDSYHWLEQVHGTALGSGSAPCLQNYGSIETREGRLLAFPNVFQHRVSPFRLADPSKPGHRRFIALWLVDPHMRIISTANVPPQQQSWWIDAAFGSSAEAKAAATAKLPVEVAALLQEKGAATASVSREGKLPRELMEMVRSYFNAHATALPMSAEEAKEHREKLMEERSMHQRTADSAWHSNTYSFCEH